ncbi:MAG: DUF1829 domain-containing protein, partial [Candidatus Cloacimonetes bacterium]|nr:DUF1829 domain-containing protein [Candidatus Cloacimonadota bacterium]
IGNLITSGVSFKKGTSKYDTIHNIATNFGISVIDEELTTKATIKNFAQKKHLMVQAMLAIDDLYVLSSSSVKNHFIEDIAEYFDQNNILYSTNLALLGKTGNYYNYDFHLQRTKIKHERFCRGYGSLTISNRNLILFNWNDTKDSRKDKSELIVIYNDTNKVSDNVLSGFEEYGIRKIIPFSKRQEMMYLDYVA